MHYIEKAVNQQLRSFICPEQREQELKKGSLTFAQATGFRRSSETIMIDAIDQGLKLKNVANCLNVTKKKRKRRRGPRILTLR
jgi:hypothetical protein